MSVQPAILYKVCKVMLTVAAVARIILLVPLLKFLSVQVSLASHLYQFSPVVFHLSQVPPLIIIIDNNNR